MSDIKCVLLFVGRRRYARPTRKANPRRPTVLGFLLISVGRRRQPETQHDYTHGLTLLRTTPRRRLLSKSVHTSHVTLASQLRVIACGEEVETFQTLVVGWGGPLWALRTR